MKPLTEMVTNQLEILKLWVVRIWTLQIVVPEVIRPLGQIALNELHRFFE